MKNLNKKYKNIVINYMPKTKKIRGKKQNDVRENLEDFMIF